MAIDFRVRECLAVGAKAEAVDGAGSGLLPVDAAFLQLGADLVGNLLVVGEDGDVAAGQLYSLDQDGGFAGASDGFQNAGAFVVCDPVEEVSLLRGRGECLGHFFQSPYALHRAPLLG